MTNKSIAELPFLNRETTNADKIYPPKILQFGGGNFLRGFVDWMIEILNESTEFKGSVIIVKPTEKGDYKALKNQDGLFHVSSSGISGGNLIVENKLITCVSKIIHSYLDWENFIKTAEIKSIRFIFSNTTEAGIKANPIDQFSQNPPKEFPAKLTRWLYHRFQYFSGSEASGCVIIPCELIADNGDELLKCVIQYADWWELGESFKTWIQSHNTFCNTLVDRIVPGFPTDRKEELFQQIGYRDELLVDAEPYHLFVIQASTAIQSELPFDQTHLNVVFTHDLTSYRKLKIRILNGLHTSMVPIGILSGIETVRETVEHERVGAFLQKLLFEEILPSLDFQKELLEKYAADILDRFKNPFIHHQLISISLNSISKFKTRVLPSILDYYQKNNVLPKRMVFAFASLIWFYRGKNKTEIILLKDDSETLLFFKNLWADFSNKKIVMEELVERILRQTHFWGTDLNEVQGLKKALVGHLIKFEENGFSII